MLHTIVAAILTLSSVLVFAPTTSRCQLIQQLAATPFGRGHGGYDVYAFNERTVFTWWESALMKSSDGGVTMKPVLSWPSTADDYWSMDFSDSLIGYLSSTKTGLWRTTDLGDSWTNISAQFTGGVYAQEGLVITSDWIDFYESRDIGKTFVSIGNRGASMGNKDHNRLQVLSSSGPPRVARFRTSANDGLTYVLGDSLQLWAGEYFTLYLQPFTDRIFGVLPGSDGGITDDNPSRVFRSTNAGLSFITLAGYKSPWYLTKGIAGSGCSVFLQGRSNYSFGGIHDSGIYYSTDFGDRWIKAGGGPNRADSKIAATGRGKFVFFSDYFGSFYRMTLPNDPNYHSTILEDIVIGRKDKKPLSDTLKLALCDSAKYLLTLDHLGCDGFKLTSFDAQDTSGFISTSSSFSSVRISSSKQREVSISVRPLSKGVSVLPVKFSVVRDDYIREDTTIELIVQVIASPGILSVSPQSKRLDFGKQPLCTPRTKTLSFKLKNLGCENIEVGSASLLDGAAEGFSLLTQSGVELVRNDTERTYFISWTPSGAGKVTGHVVVAHSGGTDTLLLLAEGIVDDKLELAAQSDSLVTRMCDSVQANFSLTNLSCSDATILSLQLPLSQLRFQPALSLPISMAKGETKNFTIRYVPTAVLSTSERVTGRIEFDRSGNKVTIDTVFPLEVKSVKGVAVAAVDRDTVDFGTVSTCSSAQGRIVIRNSGCDTLLLSGLTLSATNGVMASTLSRDSLAVGDSSVVTLDCKPSVSGDLSGELTVQTSDGLRTIVIKGHAEFGSGLLSLSSSNVDFAPVVAACTADTLSIQLGNRGCAQLNVVRAGIQTIGAFSILDPAIGVLDTPDHRMIRIAFDPTTVGSHSDVLDIVWQDLAGVEHTTSVQLKGLAAPSPQFEFGAKVIKSQVPSGDLVPIELDGWDASNSGVAAGELTFDLALNTDVLTAQTIDPEPGVTASYIETPTGVRVTLTKATPLTATREKLATLNVASAISDEMSSEVSLTSADFTSATTCATILASHEIMTVNLTASCGDSLVSAAMGNRLPFMLHGIHPNPTSGTLTVDVTSDGVPLNYTVEDALGRSVMHGEWEGPARDCQRLSSGVYFLRLEGAGQVQTRMFIKR